MKKLQYILFVLVLASCNNKDSIWNVMGDMDSRVSTLETLCQEMNTNIAALETLIKAQNNGDYITNVTEIRNGNTIVGYTITFNHHDPITIYNGTNGKDGRDGVDGYKPVVGAKQDTDGVYYWTVDGNWLTDANGNKIRVTGDKGQDGQDGTDGTDGTNGVNGNTPQLKIENNYWYISYDGTNWTQLGKATGADGADGKDGKDGTNGTNSTNGSDGAKGDKGDKGDAGDTIFRSVTQDDNYVYFTLSDGTLIKLAKNGSSSGSGGTHADADIIDFKDLNVKSALLHHTPEIDTDHDGEISYAEAKAVKRIIIKSNADIVSFKELQYFENLTSVDFESCSKLFEVCLPTGLDSIAEQGFASCQNLKNLVIPTGCKYIGTSAFNASKTRVTFSDIDNTPLEYLGAGLHLSIANGKVPNSVKYLCANAIKGGNIIHLPYNLVGPIVSYENFDTVVWNCPNWAQPYTVDNVYLYDGLELSRSYKNRVLRQSGSYTSAIKAVLFGKDVTKIPDYLCGYLTGLTNIIIPDNVEEIGDFAFRYCPNLTEVTIGKKVRSIGRYAFDGTEYGNSLKKIYCKAQQPPIIDLSFPNSVSVIYVPRESVEEYRVVWSDFASKILGYDFE